MLKEGPSPGGSHPVTGGRFVGEQCLSARYSMHFPIRLCGSHSWGGDELACGGQGNQAIPHMNKGGTGVGTPHDRTKSVFFVLFLSDMRDEACRKACSKAHHKKPTAETKIANPQQRICHTSSENGRKRP